VKPVVTTATLVKEKGKTYTVTAIQTVKVTREVRIEVPTELQEIIEVIPFWALAAIGGLAILLIAVGAYAMGARARARQAPRRRRRR